MTFVSIMSSFLIGFFDISYNVYFLGRLIFNLSWNFIDTLAEGISVIILNLNKKIFELETRIKEIEAEGKGSEEDGQPEGSAAFANFSGIRRYLAVITTFLGGISASRITIHTGYKILSIYPIVMFVLTLIFFKETKVNFCL